MAQRIPVSFSLDITALDDIKKLISALKFKDKSELMRYLISKELKNLPNAIKKQIEVKRQELADLENGLITIKVKQVKDVEETEAKEEAEQIEKERAKGELLEKQLQDIHYYWDQIGLTNPELFTERMTKHGKEYQIDRSITKLLELDVEGNIGQAAQEVFELGCKEYGIRV